MRAFRSLHRAALPVLLAYLAGCTDIGVPGTAPQVVDSRISGTYAADGQSADIVVSPSGGWFELGPHAIRFPAHAICDPATTAYGPAHWDEPCETIQAPIQIHAELRVQDGYPLIHFTPELRFQPRPQRPHWVWLYMRTDAVQDPALVERLRILWVPTAGAEPVDESLADPTLRTHVDQRFGYVYRRIKHFSTYAIVD